MTTNSTIKWRPIWKVWIPIVLFLIPLILEGKLLGTLFTPYVYGLIVLIAGIIYFLRLRLWHAPVVMTMTTIAIWTYFLAARPVQTLETFSLIGLHSGPDSLLWLEYFMNMTVWFVILIINFIIFYSLGPVLLKALSLEKAGIRLFKLAAREVSSELNGFTGRPFRAGEHSYKRDKIIGLASFLEQKNICTAEFPGAGIRLIFSMGISPLNFKYRNKLSYVAFEDDGSLNIFISESDYKQYKKQYTFDQLCELMGKTFLRFADYYDNKIENRIMIEMKSV